MSDRFLKYVGLYGDQRQPFSEAFIHYEPLRKRSEFYDYKITEHLHSELIQFFFIKEGGGLMLSGKKKIALNTPCILIIPSNTLHGFVFQSNISGDVWSISSSFFESSLEQEKKVLLQLNRLQQLLFEEASPTIMEIEQFKHNLIAEMGQNKTGKQTILRLHFQLFLMHLYRAVQNKPTETIPTDNKVLAYFHAFQKLLSQHIHESYSIKAYAADLKITPVHLNRVCRALVQKSALQVVHEYVLNEAKKYLLGTDNSIAEISYFLDFNDPSHFSKFFKKMEGVTPKTFRSNKNGLS